jgi:hypothetical protein
MSLMKIKNKIGPRMLPLITEILNAVVLDRFSSMSTFCFFKVVAN